MKQIFKQIWAQTKAQPLMSAISVIGTALAIFLIMVVIMLQQVKVAPFSPESRRDRFLHYKYQSFHHADWNEGETSNGPLGPVIIDGVFNKLETVEAMGVFSWLMNPVPVSLPGQPAMNVDMQQTNTGFWRVFDFDFISGQPYTQEQFDAHEAVVVVSEGVARKLFGNTDVVGRDILINHAPHRICGVVKDVSTLATTAYAQIWIPYTASVMYNDLVGRIEGYYSVVMLAKDKTDFPKIRQEVAGKFADFEQAHPEWTFIQRNRPYDQETNESGVWANTEPDVAALHTQQMIILAILLIVPAINLSSMTHSRLRQRIGEIGVRRAFGCSRGQVLSQIIVENFMVTLVAGIIGLTLTVVFSYIFSVSLFTADFSRVTTAPMVRLDMLIRPSTIVLTLLFCFVLNLLSSGLPAWMASRTNVVKALRGN